MFELNQLEQLLAVAKYSTLSAAAEKLHLSQPALSRSMQKLEAELQVPLFTRSKNRIELNENGHMAVEYAEKILWQSQDMIRHIRAFDLSRRTIRIGSCAPAPLWDILPSLSNFYPEMTISSEIRENDVLYKGLKDKTYQFILLPESVEETDIFCRKYEEEHLFFSLPPAHPLSGCQSLRLEDLNGETMLLYAEIGFWKNILKDKMPDTRFLIQEEASALDTLVRASALPSFTTDLAIRQYGDIPNRIKIPISNEEANVSYYFLCLSDSRRQFHRFLESFIFSSQDIYPENKVYVK
ncbi:MAG: LysR family transcriptional regulator [Ruminococcus sp.]|jgi:DNA-binding transcriptional LysR family regulator